MKKIVRFVIITLFMLFLLPMFTTFLWISNKEITMKESIKLSYKDIIDLFDLKYI